jgi:hypothetical protein
MSCVTETRCLRDARQGLARLGSVDTKGAICSRITWIYITPPYSPMSN